jgi:pimeloyl-ACP methyl ester carboxylesterase
MKFLSTLILTLIIGLQAVGQKYTLEAKRGVLPGNYNYWVCTPPDYTAKDTIKTDSVKKYPLVVFLHGASLCGHDLYRVRRYGCLNAVQMGRDINAVIIAPQNPGGAWNPKKISDIMDWTTENYNIDTNRVYVLGMSLGGYGTIDFCATYPEKVSAAMALCGGSSGQGEISNLGKLPLWIIHGTADRRVGISCSKTIVSELEASQNDSLLMYTWLQGGSHGALAKLFYMDKTYEWLFSHSLADSVRQVNRDFTVEMTDLPHAYENLIRGDRINVIDTAPYAVRHSVPASFDSEVWIVKQGDVLVNIARSTHTTVDNICRLNGISRTSTLRIGQKLRVRAK